MNTKYESAYGRAVETLLAGNRLPLKLVRELIEDQGMSPLEVLGMEARHLYATFK